MDYLQIITEVIESLKKAEKQLTFNYPTGFGMLEKNIAKAHIAIHNSILKLDTIIKDLNYE